MKNATNKMTTQTLSLRHQEKETFLKGHVCRKWLENAEHHLHHASYNDHYCRTRFIFSETIVTIRKILADVGYKNMGHN